MFLVWDQHNSATIKRHWFFNETLDKPSQASLTLIGFKPRSKLDYSLYLKPGYFITGCRESRTFLTALQRRCIERSIFAVARMKLRINSPCYFVALVPSRNEPGFIVQILPFADDFRDLTDVLKDVAIDVPNDDVLDLMGSVIRKLSFTFDPKQFPNPHIECVQRAIRLIALDKEDNDSFEDRSMPKIDEKVAGPILDKLKTLSAPSRKRKEDSEQSRAKKKK